MIVRSQDQIGRAKRAAELSGLNSRILDQEADTTSGRISVCTMHLAKGLEFRAVTVIACDDEIIPLQARIDAVTDDADLEAGRGRRGHQVNFEQARVGLRCPLSSSIEVYCTERHLLYVACTRARDHLLLTATKPASEFLGDLGQ